MAQTDVAPRVRGVRRFGRRQRAFGMSETEAHAYLATKETLRRIARSSQVSSLTSGAVTITWQQPATASR